MTHIDTKEQFLSFHGFPLFRFERFVATGCFSTKRERNMLR